MSRHAVPLCALILRNQFHLAKIYEKKSASVSRPLAFSRKTWASVVGKPLPIVFFGGSAQSGSISYGKPLPTVNGELENCLKNIENSLTSLAEQIGEGSSETTSGKAAPKPDLSVSLGVKKLESIFAGLSASVMSLTAHLDETKLKSKVCLWIANKFAGVRVFISGSDLGYLGSGVAIIMDNALAKHVCKVSEVPGCLISVKLLFKNKLSVSILGLYAGTSVSVCFSQADDVNVLIAKAVNESSFLILRGDFNEDGLRRSASFKKCGNLGLVNSLVGSPLLKVPTWSNSQGVTKTIDFLFVSPNLVNAILDCNILNVVEFFDTNHQAVSVSVGLGGLLDTHLCFIRK
ncbi:hypothetical protein G9A89_015785 [Geosiphon pyriformis]|nr:hypothetical protein G9A89_015785 [Geosiphon pyriformis]